MVRKLAGILGGIAFVAVLLVSCGGLAWFGTGYTHQHIREAVAYSRAQVCPEAVDGDPNCVKVAGAVVTKRDRDTTSDTTVYWLDLGAPGRSDHVRVGDDVYDGLRVGDEVVVRRFHDKIIAIEHGQRRWHTYDTPGPPFVSGFVGTLFWAVVFGAAALLASTSRGNGEPTRWDFRWYFGALAAAVGLIIGGLVLDAFLGVVRFDPRLIYVSLALTPVASIAVITKYTLKRLKRR